MKGNIVEKHTLTALDYFDVDVTVTDEGNVQIDFRFPEAVASVGMDWDELREVLEFVGKHGLGMENPYFVEYTKTIEGAKGAKEE